MKHFGSLYVLSGVDGGNRPVKIDVFRFMVTVMADCYGIDIRLMIQHIPWNFSANVPRSKRRLRNQTNRRYVNQKAHTQFFAEKKFIVGIRYAKTNSEHTLMWWKVFYYWLQAADICVVPAACLCVLFLLAIRVNNIPFHSLAQCYKSFEYIH
jgi:hypothetical protein